MPNRAILERKTDAWYRPPTPTLDMRPPRPPMLVTSGGHHGDLFKVFSFGDRWPAKHVWLLNGTLCIQLECFLVIQFIKFVSDETKLFIYALRRLPSEQDCIPVGCVPPACCPYLPACTAPGGGVSAPGRCLPLVLGGGGGLLLGGCLPLVLGGMYPIMQWGRPPPPPVNRILDTRF